MGTGIPDGIAHRLSFVTSQIVENDDITRLEGWNEGLLDPCRKGNAVDRTIENTRCYDAVAAQASQKSQRFPVTMRHLCDERLSELAPAAGARHIGLNPGFINEDKTIGIKSVLMCLPACSEPYNLRPVPFACHQCFF
ncbi:hypothetical protein RvVAR0630_32170 [Agrobacterium vitis]|nr:hypothetical protein RvVAR0630_32170 [Agrobacterium vitis]